MLSSDVSRKSILALADELYQRPRHNVGALVQRTAFSFLIFIYFALGLRDKFFAVIEEVQELAVRTKQPNLELISMSQRARLCILGGQLEEALELGDQILSRADELSLQNYLAGGGFWPQHLRGLTYLGRATEGVASWTGREGPFVAVALAAAGRRDEAQASLARATDQWRTPAFAGLEEFRAFFGVIALEVEVALRQTEPAREMLAALHLAELAPFHPIAMVGTARILGEANLLTGNAARAREAFATALQRSEAIRFRPEIALTRLDLAELLLEHYPDEREAAIEHLDFAIAEFGEMKMQPSLERALRHLGLLRA